MLMFVLWLVPCVHYDYVRLFRTPVGDAFGGRSQWRVSGTAMPYKVGIRHYAYKSVRMSATNKRIVISHAAYQYGELCYGGLNTKLHSSAGLSFGFSGVLRVISAPLRAVMRVYLIGRV